MGKIIGIDLGTTNSCVTVMENGEPIVIPNKEGNRTTPSVVAFSKSGERLVGITAKRQAVTNPTNTIFSVKRFMGRKFEEVKHENELVPYEIIRASNGDAHIKIADDTFSPPQISAMILQKLKADAEAYLGHTVTEAVVTVPAYFNDSQRQATKDAGRIAGLDVKRIINEPTAAALAYGLDKKHDEKIAVYDLGGGTFDVSILELGDGVFEVCATNGDTHLGGDDFDDKIIKWIISEFKKENSIDLGNDAMCLQRLKDAAEKAKLELSSSQSTDINEPFITADATGPKHLQLTFTRAKLEQICDDLFERTTAPCKNCMQDSGLTDSEIDEIIMVGGQTRMPKVVETASRIFNKRPNQGVNPDEVVAIGAAIQGGVLSGDVNDVLLLDVAPLSLGIETLGGVFTKMIERNTTIPTRKSETFSTAADNQPAVDIQVYQGERQMCKDNKSIGQFKLDGIPSAPRGVPKIEVTFDIDANGIQHISAKDLGTGKEQKITISPDSGLSEEEINRMVNEAEAHADEDKAAREKIDIRNQADSTIFQTEKQLAENADKLPEELKTDIEKDIADLKVALEADDTDKMKSIMEAMQEKQHKMAEQMYAQQPGEQPGADCGADCGPGGCGPTPGATPNNADDDVIDAEVVD